MTYATPTHLITRFDAEEIAQRADRLLPRRVSGELLAAVAASGDLSGFDPADVAQAGVAMIRLQGALNDARDTIDSYVSSRYTLPINPVPPILERIGCDLARYFLYDDQVTDQVKDRFTAAMKLLGDVRDGKASLGIDVASGQEPASTAGAELVTSGRVWRRESSRGFI